MNERGIDLAILSDTVPIALERYAQQSEGWVQFDVEAARRLARTPDRYNFARSQTEVRFGRKVMGTMTLIVFAPGDGTGDLSTYKLNDLDTNRYPIHPKVVPRSKARVRAEAHLTIAALNTVAAGSDPRMFAGSLELLGLDTQARPRIQKLSELGQPAATFPRTMAGLAIAGTTATFTMGPPTQNGSDKLTRFGDPHAVYNADPVNAQLCAFIALPAESEFYDTALFHALRTQEPTLLA